MKIKDAVSSTAADCLIPDYADRGRCQGISAPGGTGGTVWHDSTADRFSDAASAPMGRQPGCPQATDPVSFGLLTGASSPSTASRPGLAATPARRDPFLPKIPD